MKIDYNNENLINALSERDEVISGLEYFSLDDEQVTMLARFKQLSQFEKDIMYLSATKPIPNVAELYGISRQYVYKLLKKIKLKLNGELDIN